MSNNSAYIYDVLPHGSGTDEDGRVHQSSPSWVLTFVGWKYRDTLRLNASAQGLSSAALDKLKDTVDPIIVINDCISVSVTCSKSSHTPNMEATLVQTDINYLTAVAPGDFVFVNMLNWEKHAYDVAVKAAQGQPINGIKDGFKGLFKVQSVRRTVSVSPSGAKSVIFKITAFAFTEFNNVIYFDPWVVQQYPGDLVFSKRLAETYYNILANQKGLPVQKIIRLLAESLIGQGIKRSTEDDRASHDSQDINYFMPAIIGQYLDIGNVVAAKDIYNFLFGIQQYSAAPSQVAHQGLNPYNIYNSTGNFFENTTDEFNCPGVSLLKGEYWNCVSTWDILSQYKNNPINELYTCFRVDPDFDIVIPTVVFRQICFTTEDFVLSGAFDKMNAKVTKFLTLPRWRIDPAMVLSEDLGRDDALRVNYVQIFGRVLPGTGGGAGSDFTMESTRGNFVYEKNDIQRSGLKPSVVTSNFDLYGDGMADAYNSVTWAKIVGDALIGGHLRLTGSLVCAGIVEPITIGDNAQYDNVVYHIEQITHSCAIDKSTGNKVFRTILSLCQGTSITSSEQYGTIYPQMSNPNAYAERLKDYKNNQILPGVAESQESLTRIANNNIDKTAPLQSPNIGFPQPKEIRLPPVTKKDLKKV